MASPYDVVPLAQGTSTNIRLVEVEVRDPFDVQDTISCKLHTVALEKAAQYKALSYTWGDADKTEKILLNGMPFSVRKNLYDFLYQWRETLRSTPRVESVFKNHPVENDGLHRMRNRTFDQEKEVSIRWNHYMWIDALCIDQSSTSERGHQVWMMGEIYASAMSVTVWLGRGNENTKLAIEALVSFIFSWNKCQIHVQSESRVFFNDEMVAPLACITSPMFMNPITELLSMPYWTRVWIVQEYALARSVEIWCGDKTLSHDVLHNAEKRILSCPHYDKEAMQNFWNSPGLQMNRLRMEDALDFWDILAVTGPHFGCADDRDRIYALFSLLDSEEKSRLTILPDYTISTSQLFEHTWNDLQPKVGKKTRLIHVLRDSLKLDEEDPVVQNALNEVKELPCENTAEETPDYTESQAEDYGSRLQKPTLRRADNPKPKPVWVTKTA